MIFTTTVLKGSYYLQIKYLKSWCYILEFFFNKRPFKLALWHLPVTSPPTHSSLILQHLYYFTTFFLALTNSTNCLEIYIGRAIYLHLMELIGIMQLQKTINLSTHVYTQDPKPYDHLPNKCWPTFDPQNSCKAPWHECQKFFV